MFSSVNIYEYTTRKLVKTTSNMGVLKDTYDQLMEFPLTKVIGRPTYAEIENTR